MTMTKQLWLIAEDDYDAAIFKRILAAKEILVIVQHVRLEGSTGGISRLQSQLVRLVSAIRVDKRWRKEDCIVVLHDVDIEQQDRSIYDRIAEICDQQSLVLLKADDKIEAWLLADTGLCKFLDTKAARWDRKPEVKRHLESLLRKKKLSYEGRTRDKLIEKIDGSGDELSQSLQEAMRSLIDNNCIA